MPGKGKALIQIDLRGKKPLGDRFLALIDEAEEPPCLQLEISGEAVNVEVKVDEGTGEVIAELLRQRHLELARRLSFQKGAANVLRRKR